MAQESGDLLTGVPDPSGKRCPKCGESKPLEEFGRMGARHQGYCKLCKRRYKEEWYQRNREHCGEYDSRRYQENKDHKLAYNKQYYRENKEKYRRHHLWSKYGLTLEEYEVLFDSQNQCCAICGSKESGVEGRGFHVDHCRETGEVRGILCNGCNPGIGSLGHDPENLRSALRYLEKYGIT